MTEQDLHAAPRPHIPQVPRTRGAPYPFSAPQIRTLPQLDVNTGVTFFVGESGSGRSTLLEGIGSKDRLEGKAAQEWQAPQSAAVRDGVGSRADVARVPSDLRTLKPGGPDVSYPP
jgi:predicted ATPase